MIRPLGQVLAQESTTFFAFTSSSLCRQTVNNTYSISVGSKSILIVFHYLRRMIPILDTVAGDACLRECVSKIKFTLFPNCIRQPDGNVNSLLSSSTEFNDSIHSGSTSPSNIIHEMMSTNISS